MTPGVRGRHLKQDEREKLMKEAADKRPQSVNAPKPPLATETLATGNPDHQIRVTVDRHAQSEQDALPTKALLEHYQTKDGFKCPRCSYSTTSPDDFIEHLSKEINKSLAGLGM